MLFKVKEPEGATVTARPKGFPVDLPLFKARRSATQASKSQKEGRPAMAAMRQRLPQTDETREAIMSAAQRAIERAREAVNNAMDQLPEFSLSSLPDSLQHSFSVPAVRRRSRRGPSRLLILGVLVGLGAGAFVAFKWFTRTTPEDYGIDEDWPEEPNRGNTSQPAEDDRVASLDAEESLEARGVIPASTGASGSDVNGAR